MVHSPLSTVLVLFLACVSSPAAEVRLAWDLPTLNADGTPLTDLAGCKVYWGVASRVYPNSTNLIGAVTNCTVRNLQAGQTYYFAGTARNSLGNESDYSEELVVNLAPAVTNRAPQVNAGSDRTTAWPNNTVDLDATVSDDGLPQGSTLSVTWSKVSGPGTVSFANAQAVDTTATFSRSGTYVLRLTATDGSAAASDDVTVVVNPRPKAPTNLRKK